MNWLSPSEFQELASDRTDKALEYINSKIYEIMYAQMLKRMEIDEEMDEEIIGELEWQLKGLRQQESTLVRLQSGLQSRLRVG